MLDARQALTAWLAPAPFPDWCTVPIKRPLSFLPLLRPADSCPNGAPEQTLPQGPPEPLKKADLAQLPQNTIICLLKTEVFAALRSCRVFFSLFCFKGINKFNSKELGILYTDIKRLGKLFYNLANTEKHKHKLKCP